MGPRPSHVPGRYFPAINAAKPWGSSSDSPVSSRPRGGSPAVPSSSIPPRPLVTAIGDGAEEAGECPPEGDGHSRPSRPSDEGRPKKGEDGRRAAIFDARRQHKEAGAHGAEQERVDAGRHELGARRRKAVDAGRQTGARGRLEEPGTREQGKRNVPQRPGTLRNLPQGA